MENITRLTIFDYDFSIDFKQILRKFLITIILLCVCTCSFYESVQYLNRDSTVQCSGTCAKYTHLSNQIISVEKPLIETAISITDTLERPEISVLTVPAADKQIDIVPNSVSDVAVIEDAMSEPTTDIIIQLPGESSDEAAAEATDKVDSNISYMGFVLSRSGTITGCVKAGCNLQDGLLVLPADERCTGIAIGAFDEIAEDVNELFIPKNITYIAPGALNSLTNLMYIQVMDRNPVYYSEKSRLYHLDN